MEEAAAVRRAALDAVGDVEPDRLYERIRERFEDGSMAPGALTLLSARAVHGTDDSTDGSFPLDPVADRAAGVQLIYEGLRLTRSLSQDPPWERATVERPDPESEAVADPDPDGGATDELTDGGDVALSDGETTLPSDPADGGEADLTDADMAVLVADIMVARGFYLLARTEAAGEAVATVQAFGRDQTDRRTTGDQSLDANLEADVFELAAVAGTTAVGGDPPADLREYVADLARTDVPLPVADGVFTDSTVRTLSGYLADGAGGVATSTDH